MLKNNWWTYKIKDLNGEKNRKLLWQRIVAEEIRNELLSTTRQPYERYNESGTRRDKLC